MSTDKPKTIKIDNIEYQVEPFKDIHFIQVIRCMSAEGVQDIDFQSKAAQSIKEIIVPSISEEIISRTSAGTYFFNLDSDDLRDLVMQLTVHYWQYKLEYAQAKNKSQDVINYINQNIANVDEAISLIANQKNLENLLEIRLKTPEESEQEKAEQIAMLENKLKNLKK